MKLFHPHIIQTSLLTFFLLCLFDVSASAIWFNERGVLECETFHAGIVNRDRTWNAT